MKIFILILFIIAMIISFIGTVATNDKREKIILFLSFIVSVAATLTLVIMI